MDKIVEVGNRIRILRKKCDLTQEELASKTGYTSRSSINKIEKGLVDLPQSKIVVIARALGVTPSYLIYGSEEDNDKSTKLNLQLFASKQKETPEESKLSEGEEMLLQLFRKLPESAQDSYIERLREALQTLGLI